MRVPVVSGCVVCVPWVFVRYPGCSCVCPLLCVFCAVQYTSVRQSLEGVIQKRGTEPASASSAREALQPVMDHMHHMLALLSTHMYKPVMVRMLLQLWSAVAVELHNMLLPTGASAWAWWV